MRRLRRRGMTLMLAIGMLTITMLAAMGLMLAAGERYAHAQRMRDRLQALECAQAGVLWARESLRNTGTLDAAVRLDFGDIGASAVTASAEAAGWRVTATGSTRRDGAEQVTRTLDVVLPEARP
jgi:hypothetical protein